MSELRADPLSPIDAATLWPQLRRLGTEVVAVRQGENLLLSSGLAAAGLTNLPRRSRTTVLGVKRGLGYRGVLLARELAGGASWEVVSNRIARDKDDETVNALLNAAALEVARRGGRNLFLRCEEGSPHGEAIRKAGLPPIQEELLFALPRGGGGHDHGSFRPCERTDRHSVFRLYCRAVPERVRRHEASTQGEWRAVLDSYDCEKDFVLEAESGVAAWVGFGEREVRILVDWRAEGAGDAALDLVEAEAPRQAALVLGAGQENLHHNVAARGYTALGVRLLCARRLAVLNSLKEVAAVPAEFALPQ